MPPVVPQPEGWNQNDALELENTEDEERKARLWRREQAIVYGGRIGLDANTMQVLADEPGFDLEQFRRLVDEGCPAPLILRLVL